MQLAGLSNRLAYISAWGVAAMDVFQVQTSNALLAAIRYTFIIVAVAALAIGAVLLFRRRKSPGLLKGALSSLLVGVILLATGVGLLSGATGGSVIVIRQGSFSVSGGFIGNTTYASSDVKAAFVGNIYTGNLTLAARDRGTSLGNIKVGLFTLSNGAAAHVVSVNQTDLFVELNTGLYLVLGTSNTAALAADFAADVAPVAG